MQIGSREQLLVIATLKPRFYDITQIRKCYVFIFINVKQYLVNIKMLLESETQHVMV